MDNWWKSKYFSKVGNSGSACENPRIEVNKLKDFSNWDLDNSTFPSIQLFNKDIWGKINLSNNSRAKIVCSSKEFNEFHFNETFWYEMRNGHSYNHEIKFK